jgi:hypothetical protein
MHVPVSCRLSAAGIRFSDHPVPARELGLPHGRLTGSEIRTGPGRGYHVPHAQAAAGMGASCIPGAAVLTRPVTSPRPAPAALPRPAPIPRLEATHRRSRI